MISVLACLSLDRSIACLVDWFHMSEWKLGQK